MADDFPKGPEDLEEEVPWDRRSPTQKDLDARTPEEEQEIEIKARVQEEVEELRHRQDPEYRRKSRIKALRSTKIDRAWSPANRLHLEYPKNGREGNYREVDGELMGFRWCHDTVRDKFGPEGWKKVSDVALARAVATTAHLREEADGRIMTGDCWLAMKPKDEIEQRNAAMFGRTEQMRSAVEDGETVGGESMAKLHRSTATKSDPIGVRYSSKLGEDHI